MRFISPLWFLGLLAPTAESQQSVFLVADQDNTIYSDPAGSLSNGSGRFMFVGTTGGRVTRGILRFDVASAVPAGARVTDVRFEAEVHASGAGAIGTADHSLHAVLADWGEGTTTGSGGLWGEGDGGPATPGSVTHLHTSYPSAFWQTPGGDFEPDASGAFGAPTAGAVVAQGPGMVADVQRWIDSPSSNLGWILKADDESRPARIYRTREYIGGALNAFLVITFEPPIGTSVCGPAAVNASGLPGEIGATGSVMASQNNVRLTAHHLTPNTFGIFVVSDTTGHTPPAGTIFGTLCLSGSIGRYQAVVQSTGPEGTFSLPIDLTAIPHPTGTAPVGAGDTLYFQAWFRDRRMGMAGSNLTDALRIDFQ